MTKFKFVVAGACAALLSFAAIAGDLQSTTLDVQGMTCASCPLTVKLALKKVSGVNNVSVDYKTHSAEIKFDPEKTGPDKLAKVVTDIGYPTTVKK